jgi:NAD(P)-dependent dehydrogenase (short-subunit alcohol dehydrogenase family)
VYIVAYFEGVIQDSETINVMVNNAGILDEKHWRKCIEINLVSYIASIYD